jgi:hypothetical protein
LKPSDAISSSRNAPEEREMRNGEGPSVTLKNPVWTCTEDGEKIEGEDGYLMHLARCQKGHLIPA